jgi:serine/threonine protein kinase
MCRFFHKQRDYEIEEGMYNAPAIKPLLPDLYASGNGNGAVRSRDGFPFPPFLVMERGMTLAEWLQKPRDSLAIFSMFKDCAELLAKLHDAEQAHRDLKPDNVLLMLHSQSWRLIDFGIGAPLGEPQAMLPALASPVLWMQM